MLNNQAMLIESAKKGNETAWDALVKKYRPRLYWLVYDGVRHEQYAEDLTQDVFVEAVKGLHGLKNPLAFFSWLRTIAARKVAAHHKSLRCAPQIETGKNISEVKDDDGRETILSLEEKIDALLEGIPRRGKPWTRAQVLKEELRKNVFTVNLRKLSHDEAEALGVKTVNAVARTLFEQEDGIAEPDPAFIPGKIEALRESFRRSRRRFLFVLAAFASKLVRPHLATASEIMVPDSVTCAVLDELTRPSELIELWRTHDYTRSNATAYRSLLTQARNPNRLLNMGVAAILDAWKSNPNVAALASNFHHIRRERWRPEAKSLRRLEQLCYDALDRDLLESMTWIDSLSYSLAAFGRPEVHKRYLQRAIQDAAWRSANAAHIERFHGTVGLELSAIERHLRDPHRVGLRRAHDAPVLLHLMAQADSQKPGNRNRIRALLTTAGRIFGNHGENAMLDNVAEFLK